MGHQVDVAYLSSGPASPELSGVMVHPLRAASNYDPYLFWQLIRLIRRIKPDIIHTWILQMDVLGGMVARASGTPWIFREPSSARAYPSNWKHSLRVRVVSGASAIVCNSRGGEEYWETQLPESRPHIIRNGLPVHLIERTAPALPPGFAHTEAPIVLYVGRLKATKNLKVFLEALQWIKRQQNVLGILCGEGPQRPELEAMIREMRLETNIHFTGHLQTSSVWALMKKASVFVSLSEYEGCPNAVMEAMACGCPLVLSDISAHREILDESCALFVDPSDIRHTAGVIVQALGNEDTNKRRTLIAREKIQGWSVAGMARNYERLYEKILSQHRAEIDRRGYNS